MDVYGLSILRVYPCVLVVLQHMLFHCVYIFQILYNVNITAVKMDRIFTLHVVLIKHV